MIKLELPFTTPSNNQLLRKYRHWAVKRRLKVTYMDEIMVALIESGYNTVDVQASGKRECKITSHRKRLLDHDNLVGGMKPLIDAIVKFGMLIDDNEDMCDLKVGQMKSKHPKTIIELKDIKEE